MILKVDTDGLREAVLSAPVIREPIAGGSLQLSGNLAVQEANNIAMLLRSGTPAGRLSVVWRPSLPAENDPA